MENIKNKIKWAAILIGPLLIITIGYWPLYQPIELKDFLVNMAVDGDSGIRVLNMPINKEYISFFAHIPIIKHQLYFKNKNKVYLIHADSTRSPYIYATRDISQEEEMKKDHAGAMTISMHYNNLEDDQFYRNIGESHYELLDDTKLYKLASSTLEFQIVDTTQVAEIDLQNGTKLQIARKISGSYVDTSLSKAIIMVRWRYFILSYIILVGSILGREKIIYYFKKIGGWLINLFKNNF